MRISLRKLSSEDKARILHWLSDPYLVGLTFISPVRQEYPVIPLSKANALLYADQLIYDLDRRSFAIEANNMHVGNVGLKKYDPISQTSEIFIEIGENECRGRGIGTAALYALLEYAFFKLSLRELRLEVLEYNYSAIRVYERLGFVCYALTGCHFDLLQQQWRVLGMHLSVDDWQAKRKFVPLAHEIS